MENDEIYKTDSEIEEWVDEDDEEADSEAEERADEGDKEWLLGSERFLRHLSQKGRRFVAVLPMVCIID
ncbi:hypothetical protein INT45_005027 [Circinella minor]|uniref:Uncharacterized protein n=1 Tax=Circinella minor TaxID=1195481 RepID=A0A8H7R3A5_9FUNG|nr:hypothetical protein INT45_005027 [Circinella minor]